MIAFNSAKEIKE